MTIILGAGLSGLIAATQFPTATIFEANGAAALSHRAVLRFRTDSLSRLTGIPFRKVTVRKSLWFAGEHCQPNIQLANHYSRKTNGGFHDRSIWNIEPVQRFIAPEDLQMQMAEVVGNRLKWDHKVTVDELRELPRPIISTMPMPALLKMVSPHMALDGFKYSGITVDRYRIKGANVYQTIYYPDPDFAVYRASITGDLLIVERSGAIANDTLDDVLESFGMNKDDIVMIDESHQQRFGKISPIDDEWRRQVIFDITHGLGVYSLGRFAVWRNILLDDVVEDTAVIKRLITSGSYGALLQHSSLKLN